MTLTPSILATAYRLACFLFLRVIPSPILQSVIPALLSLYLLSVSLSSKPARGNANPAAAVIFSLKTPSRVIKMTNIAINSLLFVCFLDLSISPYFDDAGDVVFSRIGALSDSSAKVLVRYPKLNETIHLVWRESRPNTAWSKGPTLVLEEENDWVDTVTLSGLWPSTNYEYALAGTNSSLLAYPASPLSFRTFPDPNLSNGNSHFRFVASSCILPNFPYAPLQSRRIKGFDLLADYLFPSQNVVNATYGHNTTEAPQPDPQSKHSLPASFLLFLGDFIYADIPIYFGNHRDNFRRLYRRNYQSPSFKKIYERLPLFQIYDDHEFLNNYAGAGNDSIQPYPGASDAFQIYSGRANPSPPSSTKSLDHVPAYFDFRYGDVAFFVLDTRRYRSFPTDSSEEKTMLGEDQLSRLLTWLGKANNTATFKFIVSSVPLTSLWGHDAQYDSWAGFVNEKNTLLNALHTVPNVFVLSGDRHEFAAIQFAAPAESTFAVTEFSTSPLSMFYIPFYRTLSMQSSETITKTHTKEVIYNASTDATAAATPEDKATISSEGVASDTGSESAMIEESEPVVFKTEFITEEVPKEQVFKYIPDGNYKWSSIEIDTRDSQRPTLKLEVVIDGKPSYHYEVVGKPVNLQQSTALGAFVTSNMKDILKKIGMQPSKWF
ncbi:PhoD-like phosphatase-domain-containing protein [Rhodocollybia butyracea]|uniref:PhoD-like phosphatase-domain-containing protein n=1 Tax=Rhodocollybia butyracea TaxID=206335 RepID=A0A9P5U8T2_9AGAR|nr:PhoD-like phosphatase-domain-containing protein [Rhodocollybia butyracea]